MFALTMAVNPGRCLDRALDHEHMNHDEAWRWMDCRDGAQFSRALTGERPLDLHKLVRLPWDVFLAFWTELLTEKARDFGTEFRADRKRMAKAELPQAADRKVGA